MCHMVLDPYVCQTTPARSGRPYRVLAARGSPSSVGVSMVLPGFFCQTADDIHGVHAGQTHSSQSFSSA